MFYAWLLRLANVVTTILLTENLGIHMPKPTQTFWLFNT